MALKGALRFSEAIQNSWDSFISVTSNEIQLGVTHVKRNNGIRLKNQIEQINFPTVLIDG